MAKVHPGVNITTLHAAHRKHLRSNLNEIEKCIPDGAEELDVRIASFQAEACSAIGKGNCCTHLGTDVSPLGRGSIYFGIVYDPSRVKSLPQYKKLGLRSPNNGSRYSYLVNVDFETLQATVVSARRIDESRSEFAMSDIVGIANRKFEQRRAA